MRLAVLLLLLSTPVDNAYFPVRIQNIKGSVVAARPYTAPLLILQVKQGTPTQGSVVECKQGILQKDFADHGENAVEFRCGDLVLELKGVYFGD